MFERFGAAAQRALLAQRGGASLLVSPAPCTGLGESRPRNPSPPFFHTLIQHEYRRHAAIWEGARRALLALKQPKGDINARREGESHHWGLLGGSWRPLGRLLARLEGIRNDIQNEESSRQTLHRQNGRPSISFGGVWEAMVIQNSAKTAQEPRKVPKTLKKTWDFSIWNAPRAKFLGNYRAD